MKINIPCLYYMKAGFQPMDNENTDITLQRLGFEEGELEMFFGMHDNVSPEELIQRYLEISREDPFNLGWQSVRNAINAPNETGVFKSNGVEYIKHDIAKDALNSFDNFDSYDSSDDMQEGGYKRRKSKTRTRKTKRRKSKKPRRIRRRRTHKKGSKRRTTRRVYRMRGG